MSGAVQSFSTAEVTPRSRVARWNEFGSETLSSLSVDPADADNFNARLSRSQIGNIGLGWIVTTAVTCIGGVGRVGAWSAPMGDAFVLNIQEEGTSSSQQLGREVTCRPGAALLIDATRPGRTSSSAPMNMTFLKVPAEQLLRLVPDPEAVCCVCLAGEEEKALAVSLLLSIKRAIALHPAGAWRDTYGPVLLDIVAVILGGAIEPADRSVKGADVRRKACAFIERSLDDPSLSVATIAEAIGTTARTLQRSFVEVGQTPRRYMVNRRLSVATERLRRSGEGTPSIASIAYSVGFNDLSYFIRSFRKKLGVSPREYRNGKFGRA